MTDSSLAKPQAAQAANRRQYGSHINDVKDVEVLRRIAVGLWDLLDAISTSDDAIKPRDEESLQNFREATLRRVARRGELLASDGYELYLPKDGTDGESETRPN